MPDHKVEKEAEKVRETVTEANGVTESAVLAEEDLEKVSGGGVTHYRQRKTPGVY